MGCDEISDADKMACIQENSAGETMTKQVIIDTLTNIHNP